MRYFSLILLTTLLVIICFEYKMKISRRYDTLSSLPERGVIPLKHSSDDGNQVLGIFKQSQIIGSFASYHRTNVIKEDTQTGLQENQQKINDSVESEKKLYHRSGNIVIIPKITQTDSLAGPIKGPVTPSIGKILILHIGNDRKYTTGAIFNLLETFHFRYVALERFVRPLFLNNRFSLVIVTDMFFLYHMQQSDYAYLINYCKEVKIGMIIFPFSKTVIKEFGRDISISTCNFIQAYEINKTSAILNITRSGGILRQGFHGNDHPYPWFTFNLMRNKGHYHPIAYAWSKCSGSYQKHITVFLDNGAQDGVQKIFFGYGLEFWLHRYLFVDAMHYLSAGIIKLPFQRYFMLDIDDVFRVNWKDGLTKDDIKSMVNLTYEIRRFSSNFKLGLLFCGRSFKSQSATRHIFLENSSDIILLEQKEHFTWYDHTYQHINASSPFYAKSPEGMTKQMIQNRFFAKQHNLSVNGDYVVTKAHTGLYPPVDSIYHALNKMNVKVTGTDRYWKNKHGKSFRRAGFIYNGIAVLPRIEWSGIDAENRRFSDYEGGKALFINHMYRFMSDILETPVSIQFLHYKNFGFDRVGNYAIKLAFETVRKWTNIELIQKGPCELANIHFDIFPEDRIPIFEHPCRIEELRCLWDSSKRCDQFPNVLLVGPDETGAPLLSWLLQLHPRIRTSANSASTGVGFLDRNYLKGINWYYKQFIQNTSSTETEIIFDATESYFSSLNAPKRAHFMMLNGYVIVTIVNPIERALSVYKYLVTDIDGYPPLLDIISVQDTASSKLTALQKQILLPGRYMDYIKIWSQYFQNDRLLIIDGEELQKRPVEIMNHLQSVIGIQDKIDYSSILSLNEEKMICSTVKKNSCISTAEKWPEQMLSEREKEYLNNYYRDSNEELQSYLQDSAGYVRL